MNNYSLEKPTPLTKAMPRFFTQVKYAKCCLAIWLMGISKRKYWMEYGQNMEDVVYTLQVDRMPHDFEVVPVYVTISALSVDDIDDLDIADADLKQRIKQLGLTCVKGGK
jgi:hypothetical protein